MQYLGGKARTYKQICAFLESKRVDNQHFIEPFCGAGWITQGMSGKCFAYDANTAMIALHNAIKDGWIPPDSVSEEEYMSAKSNQDLDDPMTAFIGIGCSFGGKWFGGYARGGEGRNYAKNAKNSLLKKHKRMGDVSFECVSYNLLVPTDCLVYCDPPYASTTGYGAIGLFDSDKFWSVMREWSRSNTVVISEYKAPSDFICTLEIKTKVDMQTKAGGEARTERLFMHKDSV